MTGMWQQFSKEISEVVDQAGKSIVAVDGRAGHTSSGIVWRRDSVLTAAHAIRQETNIGVIFAAGRSVAARLIGRDRGTDIALLTLDQDIEMRPVQFGSTQSLAVGEFTVAVSPAPPGATLARARVFTGDMCAWEMGPRHVSPTFLPHPS